MVDVASGAKTKGESTEDESEGDTNERYAPARCLGKDHEVTAHEDLPADLEVER